VRTGSGYRTLVIDHERARCQDDRGLRGDAAGEPLLSVVDIERGY